MGLPLVFNERAECTTPRERNPLSTITGRAARLEATRICLLTPLYRQQDNLPDAWRLQSLLTVPAHSMNIGYVALGDARLTIESVGRLPRTASLVPARVCLVDAAWRVRRFP